MTELPPDARLREEPGGAPALAWPLVISLVLHGLVLFSLLSSRIYSPALETAGNHASFRIRLNVLRPSTPDSAAVGSAGVQNQSIPEITVRDSETEAPLQSPLPNPPSTPASTETASRYGEPRPSRPEPPPAPERPALILPLPGAEAPPLQLPDPARAVTEVLRRNAGRPDDPPCDPRQRFNELFDCEDEPQLDFDSLERNSAVDFFNPRPERSRARESIGLIAARVDEIAEVLTDSGVDEGLRQRVLESIQTAEEDLLSTGNSKLNTLQDQIMSGDSTYRQMKRAMGESGWQ